MLTVSKKTKWGYYKLHNKCSSCGLMTSFQTYYKSFGLHVLSKKPLPLLLQNVRWLEIVQHKQWWKICWTPITMLRVLTMYINFSTEQVRSLMYVFVYNYGPTHAVYCAFIVLYLNFCCTEHLHGLKYRCLCTLQTYSKRLINECTNSFCSLPSMENWRGMMAFHPFFISSM